MIKQAEPVLTNKARLGEGALWCGPRNVLYWVDILGNLVFAYDLITSENKGFNVGEHVGTVVPRKSGGVMLALPRGFASLDLTTGKVDYVAVTEEDPTRNCFNDGKCDPAGRFWAGTMSYEFIKGAGTLYLLEIDVSVRKVIQNVTGSNGLVWTTDKKTSYYIGSLTYQIAAFDYDIETGNIANRRVAVTIEREHGLPDGMAIDIENMIWAAFFGGGKFFRFNPKSGDLLEIVVVPGATQVTSCAFGGVSLDELYITTASCDFNTEHWNQQPLAGSLFKVRVDVQGVAAFEFLG